MKSDGVSYLRDGKIGLREQLFCLRKTAIRDVLLWGNTEVIHKYSVEVRLCDADRFAKSIYCDGKMKMRFYVIDGEIEIYLCGRDFCRSFFLDTLVDNVEKYLSKVMARRCSCFMSCYFFCGRLHFIYVMKFEYTAVAVGVVERKEILHCAILRDHPQNRPRIIPVGIV